MPNLGISDAFGGVELEAISSTAQYKPGHFVRAHDGGLYMYVLNSLGSAPTRYLAYFLSVSAAGVPHIRAIGSDQASGPIGIPQFATSWTNAFYGWICVGGVFKFTSAAGITAHAKIGMSTTDGKFDDAEITGETCNAICGTTAASNADETPYGFSAGPLFNYDIKVS